MPWCSWKSLPRHYVRFTSRFLPAPRLGTTDRRGSPEGRTGSGVPGPRRPALPLGEKNMQLLKEVGRGMAVLFERVRAAANIVEVLLTYPGLHAREIRRLAHPLWNWRVPVLP